MYTNTCIHISVSYIFYICLKSETWTQPLFKLTESLLKIHFVKLGIKTNISMIVFHTDTIYQNNLWNIDKLPEKGESTSEVIHFPLLSILEIVMENLYFRMDHFTVVDRKWMSWIKENWYTYMLVWGISKPVTWLAFQPWW